MAYRKKLYKDFDVPEYPLSFENEQEREQIKREIHERLHRSIAEQQPIERKGLFKFLTSYYSIAAVVVTLISVLLIAYNYYFATESVKYITLRTHKGKILEIHLPDSSKVILNAASTLRYPVEFTDTRDVYLDEGEAYFDVAHDKSKPFIVHSGAVNTKVLGTAFNVKSYKTLPTITVTVARGKVRVDDKDRNLGILTPEQQLIVDKTNLTVVNKSIRSADAICWMSGKFVMKDAYFNEIMLAISNRFNVEMEYDSIKFKNCQNSIEFTPKQTLVDVLKVLKDIQGIKSVIKKNKVFILGEPCE
ncbi:FecR domain-containing protein [Solitalea sp. MAHUQ-68]|uniref:FecR domain-containing protein n=1 Tax=Solitalea agri TaxID=2953739 RepID=A0A9X2F6C3_9SPHI|nr:FecR family protein [Solitalea agri]MCO4292698.1 FecR domain-containing protein [Solitalea agri]